MFKAILLSSVCSLFIVQAIEARTFLCGKEIFSDEATLPSSVEDSNTSKKKKDKSSQSVPKPKTDESGTSPSLLSPSADKEIFPDE